MRTRQFLLATHREIPADAELISHQLMLKAGLIRKLSSGLYTLLPLGFRVLKKVQTIIREEMDRSGALELLMPLVQPADLWQESGRWEQYGPELLRLTDRHQRSFCLGPTHEEVITDLMRNEIKSYKQLPLNFYQMATKFRDEIRPRFGIMRAREFIMKDSYSFHIDEASLAQTYEVMYKTYTQIFTRLGLTFRAVLADSGSIGGNFSHEFQVLADAGEDVLAVSDGSDYAANLEQACALKPTSPRAPAIHPLEKIATPDQKTIHEVAAFLHFDPKNILKTLIVKGREQPLVALVLRGNDELNPLKAEKLPEVAKPLTFASETEIKIATGCDLGSLGPIGLSMPTIVDHHAAHLDHFVCGANETGFHLKHVNWARDLPEPQTADLRQVMEGDPSPDGRGVLRFKRGIEVGHIFQLGYKYSEAMKAHVLNEQGKSVPMAMGCYGIGVTRIIAAAIEQNHDDRGIIWPQAIAPFDVVIIPINLEKSERLKTAVLALYDDLKKQGLDVLLDDRHERPGVMFADMDLIGIPHRLVINDRNLDEKTIEYKARNQEAPQIIAIDSLSSFLKM